MTYVSNIKVITSEDEDYTKSKPTGNSWYVVRNIHDQAQDFNQGGGGKYVFIFYQTSESSEGIEAIRFVEGENAKEPAGWTKIDVNLNSGTDGCFIYLCYRKSVGANFIKLLCSGFGDSEESAFDDFEMSDAVLRQDLARGTGGKYIYLGYKFIH
ncbi:hypothetical protein [Vibrio nigripulchritudo]|uniref:hypothetical protein n=1 Tax=Vibrio nigripulchritudo TaxID=28173 RepID=UPI0003B199FC|nr:hypothetical protein [Vibrio nigripulchritudo]CCN72234.1 hypothetical protein VIBNISFn118_530019 [Vibrio nigripulchritudo SFn118]